MVWASRPINISALFAGVPDSSSFSYLKNGNNNWPAVSVDKRDVVTHVLQSADLICDPGKVLPGVSSFEVAREHVAVLLAISSAVVLPNPNCFRRVCECLTASTATRFSPSKQASSWFSGVSEKESKIRTSFMSSGPDLQRIFWSNLGADHEWHGIRKRKRNNDLD
jgi:hypothetical protein